jgi:hypothetical protein
VKNAHAIGGLSRQLQKVSERIDLLAMDIDGVEQTNTNLADFYMEHLLDELGCAQALVLKITEMTVEATGEPEANADEGEGSVFAEGDLTAAKGEKPKVGEGKK